CLLCIMRCVCILWFLLFVFFFFFQAEDGIRDRNVTGVQTCALPIYQGGQGYGGNLATTLPFQVSHFTNQRKTVLFRHRQVAYQKDRKSVVGKECRSRWSAYH